jgi:putative FmdB family regulatory protein
MPIYTFKCPECKSIIEIKRTIAERNVPPECPDCEIPADRVYLPQNFNMNGNGRDQSDSITQWQFNNLDDKPKRTRLSPDAIL